MSAEVHPTAALFSALAKAVAASTPVSKGAENTFSRYKYASAESIIEEARGRLAAEGIAVLPKRWRIVPLPGGPVSGGGKASMHFADVEVTYLVTHRDGGMMECEASTPAVLDNGRPQDKAVATALTYSLGYFLRGLLLLPRVDAEHDVDQRDDRDFKPAKQRDDRRADVEVSRDIDYESIEAGLSMAQSCADLRKLVPLINDVPQTKRNDRWRDLRARYGKLFREMEAAEADAAIAKRDEEPAK